MASFAEIVRAHLSDNNNSRRDNAKNSPAMGIKTTAPTIVKLSAADKAAAREEIENSRNMKEYYKAMNVRSLIASQIYSMTYLNKDGRTVLKPGRKAADLDTLRMKLKLQNEIVDSLARKVGLYRPIEMSDREKRDHMIVQIHVNGKTFNARELNVAAYLARPPAKENDEGTIAERPLHSVAQYPRDDSMSEIERLFRYGEAVYAAEGNCDTIIRIAKHLKYLDAKRQRAEDKQALKPTYNKRQGKHGNVTVNP